MSVEIEQVSIGFKVTLKFDFCRFPYVSPIQVYGDTREMAISNLAKQLVIRTEEGKMMMAMVKEGVHLLAKEGMVPEELLHMATKHNVYVWKDKEEQPSEPSFTTYNETPTKEIKEYIKQDAEDSYDHCSFDEVQYMYRVDDEDIYTVSVQATETVSFHMTSLWKQGK